MVRAAGARADIITVAGKDINAAAKHAAGGDHKIIVAAGGDGTRIRAFTRDEAMRVSDQLSPGIVDRAWEYYAALSAQRTLGA